MATKRGPTRHDILARLDSRAGNDEENRYTAQRIRKRIEDGLVAYVLPETGIAATLEALKQTRDDAGAKVVILPTDYRIPSGDTDDAIKDVAEKSYHSLHLPRFFRRAALASLEAGRAAKKDAAWLRAWTSGPLKTITREAVAAARVRPEDVVPFALDEAVERPWSGAYLSEREGETPPKIGVGFWNLNSPRARFVLIPYINAVDGARILARSELQGELPDILDRVFVDPPTPSLDQGYSVRGRVVSSSPGREGKVYRTRLELVALAPPKAAGLAAERAWRVQAGCECDDYKWRAEKNDRQALPTVKYCKHLVATELKASELFPYIRDARPPQRWHGGSVPIPSSFAMKKAHELATRVLIPHEDGVLNPLNKTEISFFLASYEVAMRAGGYGPMFSYGRLAFEPPAEPNLQRLVAMERRLLERR